MNDRVLEPNEERPEKDIEALWRAEVRRRVAAYQRGESVLHDADEVMAEAARLAP